MLTLAVCVLALYGGLVMTRNLSWLRPEVGAKESYARSRQDCQQKNGFAGAEYERCMRKARKLAWKVNQ